MSATEGRGVAPGRSAAFWGLRESVPLLITSAGLFLAGFVCYWFSVRVGPSAFSLWALLIVLGFVAAIGASVSWFFADEEARMPSEPEVSREEMGRPRPEVARTPEAEPWFEGPPTPPPVTTVASPHQRTPSPETGLALQEIDVIQREVASRRTAEAATPR